MGIKSVFAAAAVVFAGFFSAAEAVPISYEVGGSFDGTVGGNAVSGAFDWMITSDTDFAISLLPGVLGLPELSSVININNNGTPITLNTSAIIGFFAEPGTGQFAFIDSLSPTQGIFFGTPALIGYNGLSAHGIIPIEFGQIGPIATDQGDFVVSNAPNNLLLFRATGGLVPEPLTLALFGAGVAGVGVMRRRKQKT